MQCKLEKNYFFVLLNKYNMLEYKWVMKMKLMLIIISSDDAEKVSKALIKEKFIVTKLATTGGLLLNGNTTLLVGTEDEKVEAAANIVSEHCKSRKQPVPREVTDKYSMFSSLPVDVQVGGATIFVLEVSNFYKV